MADPGLKVNVAREVRALNPSPALSCCTCSTPARVASNTRRVRRLNSAQAHAALEDLASIKKVVHALPELKRQKREVAKHVAICSDLSKRVAPLFMLSEVQREQLMAAV